MVLSALMLVGCGTKSAVVVMSAKEAKENMDKDNSIIIVDVRTKEEFDSGHIEGAILIPNETIDKTKPELLPDENAKIYIYCRSGNRSNQAGKKLVAMGYKNVVDFGGINSWTYGVVK